MALISNNGGFSDAKRKIGEDALNERHLKMFGCNIEDFRKSMEESLTFKFSGASMIAMSLLSDAQEEIAVGLKEQARQTINRAKWVISEYLTPERE